MNDLLVIKKDKPKEKSEFIDTLFRILIVCIFLYIICMPGCMKLSMKKYIYKESHKIPGTYTALVLGAKIHKNGTPSKVLQDRLSSALELYKKGIVKRFLLSGDHSRKRYNEVGEMKKYLLKNGVKSEDLFLDHTGFNTYSSIVRAKEIFLVTNLIIVTQKFHLPRAVYIARKKEMLAYGHIADRRNYPEMKYYVLREYFARIKSFVEVLFNLKPKFLGEQIPITGNSKLSW